MATKKETTPQDIAQNARANTTYKEEDFRYLVSSFSNAPDDNLVLLPQLNDTIWKTLDDGLVRLSATVAICVLPVFWQMGPMFFITCRARGVPVSVATPRNIPLAHHLLSEVEADVVVATEESALDLFDVFNEKEKRQIKLWHIVSSFNERPDPKLSGEVIIEYHLFPGVPVLFHKQGDKQLNVYPGYEMSVEDGKCYLTSTEEHATKLERTVLPGTYEYVADGIISFHESGN